MRGGIFLAGIIMVLSVCVFAQGPVFNNPKVDFTVEIGPNWHLITESDAIGQSVEFINGTDRNDGLLRIRKEIVDKDTTAAELAGRDQDQGLRFQPGFVEGKQEPFEGHVSGVVITYEYTSGGKPMSGRIYYLQPNKRTIYTLRFTGLRSKLGILRTQTDIIARSFKLK